MRSLLTIVLCLLTALASTPGFATGAMPAEGACGCHRACCCAPDSQGPAKPAPVVPASKASGYGWKYQAEATLLKVPVVPQVAPAAALPTTEVILLERIHEVPLFVRHCRPLL